MVKKYIVILFLFIVLFTSCNNQYEKYAETRFAMGSYLEIILFSRNRNEAKTLMDKAFQLASELEKKISTQLETSVVSTINKAKRYYFKNSEDLVILNLIKESIEYSKLTDGAFDASLYNVTKLWGFSSSEGPFIPDKNEINNALKYTGYKNIIVKDQEVLLLNNISLDFGGIAQGKIIGEIANFFKEKSVKDFLINASGDIYISGKFKGERLWRIAIASPYEKDKFIGFINLTDVCIITSGDYEKFVLDKDGKKYHHIINPKTGFPVDNNVHSVTVICKDPVKTDALATGIFVMGEKKGVQFANEHNDVDVIIISGEKENYKISTSKNITFEKIDKHIYEFIYKR